MSRYQIIAQSDHRTVVVEFKLRPEIDTGFLVRATIRGRLNWHSQEWIEIWTY